MLIFEGMEGNESCGEEIGNLAVRTEMLQIKRSVRPFIQDEDEYESTPRPEISEEKENKDGGKR